MQEASKLSIVVDNHLVHPGDFFETQGILPLDEYQVGNHQLRLPQGVQYEFRLTHVEEGVLLEGKVEAKIETVCDLCLEDTTFFLAVPISTLYLFQEPEQSVLNEAEDDIEVLSQDHKLEFSDIILQSLVLETPFVIKCKPDCAGLCPICGKNRNYGACHCKHEHVGKNPFFALSGLKEDLEKTERKHS